MTLLKEGPLTGTIVCRRSGVPHGKTYEALLNLAEKGFVSVTNIKPKIFQAVKPEIALRQLLTTKINNYQDLEKELLQKLKDIKIISKKEETSEKIAIIKGRKNMFSLIEQNYVTANKYVKAMFTYESYPYSLIRQIEEAIKRGVKIKHLAIKMTTEGRQLMKDDIKRGVKVRYYPVSEMRIGVKDGVEALQTIVGSENPENRVTVLIESKALTKALEHYFDFLWGKAENIK